MADPEEPAPPGRDEPEGPERFLAPFFRDPSLWPVLCVAVTIFVVLGAAALLMAFVERNPFAVGAVLLLFWMSVDAAIRARRRGGSSRLLVGIAAYWLLATGAALAARWAGWF